MDIICRFSANLCVLQTRSISLCIPLLRTHYEVLGVPRNASLREIKEAYYKRSKIYHPDNQDEGSSREFLELKKAYDILRRPADRKIYDNLLRGIYTGQNHSRSHNYQGQSWQSYWNHNYNQSFHDSFRSRQADIVRSWRNIFWFTVAGLTLIIIYNFNFWYTNVKRQRKIESMIVKDEIARSFLRQREYQDRIEDSVQIDHFARLLHADIEEAQRLRDEERVLSGIRNPFEIRESDRWMAFVQTPEVENPRKSPIE